MIAKKNPREINGNESSSLFVNLHKLRYDKKKITKSQVTHTRIETSSKKSHFLSVSTETAKTKKNKKQRKYFTIFYKLQVHTLNQLFSLQVRKIVDSSASSQWKISTEND